MVYTYQPPLMDIDKETLPELQPIFAFLNSHTNKLYQEGYFLKLDDQDISRSLHHFPYSPDLLTSPQRETRIKTEPGRNALRSLSALFCHYGMLLNSTQLARMGRCSPSSSI